MDVIICAAANCLGINLAAFQNIRGKAVIINMMCAKKPSEITVFLKYDHDINNPASNHYSAIVLMPDKILEEVAMANEDVDNHEPTPAQSEVPSDNIKVVINLNTRNQQKKRKCNRLDAFLLAETTVEQVHKIPWDIDDNITYQMKSDADFWINDMHDGRLWHTVESK